MSVAVVGAAIFLRYSLAQFLRFWLARLIYEQQAATDRIVESRSSLTPSRQRDAQLRGMLAERDVLVDARRRDGQAEHALADDVALHLLGAAAEPAAPLAEELFCQ